MLLEVSDRVAGITLNRPEVLNALDLAAVQELESSVKDAEREGAKVVLLRGAGGNFCAGADLKYLFSILDKPLEMERFITQINRAFNALEEFPGPVIAVVEGYALAGGFEMILSCDLAIASEDATLGDQHINFGLIPGGGGTQRLPRLLGPRMAKEILFTGRWLSGREAEKLGLVNRAVPAARLESEVNSLVGALVDKSLTALRHMKYLVGKGSGLELLRAIDLEVGVFYHHMGLPEAREGLNAFREKRKPRY